MATTVAKRVDDIPRKWYRHEELESLVQSTCKLGGQLRLLGKLEDSLLQVSYYDATEHCLALSSVSTPYRLFALALSILNPSTSVYATAPYEDAFNWSEVMHTLKALASYERYHWPQTEFYVVDFRSQLKAELDRDKLFELDRESHREATQSGGLLKYWFGTPDSERKNLATCMSLISNILTLVRSLARQRRCHCRG